MSIFKQDIFNNTQIDISTEDLYVNDLSDGVLVCSNNLLDNAIIGSNLSYTAGSKTLNVASNISVANVTVANNLQVASLNGVLLGTAGVVSGNADTDDLPEGSTNQYFTNARARNAISLTGAPSFMTYNATTGVFDVDYDFNQNLLTTSSPQFQSEVKIYNASDSSQIIKLYNNTHGGCGLLSDHTYDVAYFVTLDTNGTPNGYPGFFNSGGIYSQGHIGTINAASNLVFGSSNMNKTTFDYLNAAETSLSNSGIRSLFQASDSYIDYTAGDFTLNTTNTATWAKSLFSASDSLNNLTYANGVYTLTATPTFTSMIAKNNGLKIEHSGDSGNFLWSSVHSNGNGIISYAGPGSLFMSGGSGYNLVLNASSTDAYYPLNVVGTISCDTSLTIDAVSIGATALDYCNDINQQLTQSSSPTFQNLTLYSAGPYNGVNITNNSYSAYMQVTSSNGSWFSDAAVGDYIIRSDSGHMCIGAHGSKSLKFFTSDILRGSFDSSGNLIVGSLNGVLKASSGTVSGGATTSDLTEGSNLYYTDERVDDRVSSLVQNGTGISWSYNDGANTLTPTVTLAPFSTSNLSEGSNLYFTTERVDDQVATLIQNGTGISWSYNDGANTLTPTVTLAPFSTSNLSEGSNLYYTDARSRAAISLTGTCSYLSYNSGTGVFTSNYNFNQDLTTVNAPSFVGLELRYNGSTPYLDFTNDNSNDYDVRLILNGSNNLEFQNNVGIFDFNQAISCDSTITAADNVTISGSDKKFIGTAGVCLECNSDVHGTARLYVQNRIGSNGVLMEQAGPHDLVTLGWKGLTAQRNMTYENRGGSVYIATPEFQIGQGGTMNVVIADGILAVKSDLRIYSSSSNTNYISMKCNTSSGNYTITFPQSQGSANTLLKNDGSGNLTWSALSANDSLGNLTYSNMVYSLKPDPTFSHVGCYGSILLLSGSISQTELGYCGGVTAGTVTQSKSLVCDSNKDLASLRHLGMTGNLTLGGNLVMGSETLTEAKLGELIDMVDSDDYDFDEITANKITVDGAAPNIVLNNGTSNMINFGTNGYAAPSVSGTRSTGTKIILYDSFVNATSVDYALGIEAGAMWQSVPTSSHVFYWYHGTTKTIMLENSGMTIYGGLVTTGAISTTNGYKFPNTAGGAYTTMSHYEEYDFNFSFSGGCFSSAQSCACYVTRTGKVVNLTIDGLVVDHTGYSSSYYGHSGALLSRHRPVVAVRQVLETVSGGGGYSGVAIIGTNGDVQIYFYVDTSSSCNSSGNRGHLGFSVTYRVA